MSTADQINEAEPAFSRPATLIEDDRDYPVDGLSKLEYAAIQIAAGLAQSDPFDYVDMVADRAVRLARAVLAKASE